MDETSMHELPLRERKKEMIRQTIVASAERLFEEKGFDAVTVAEIADVSNVSTKTLFTYFRSKEDLIFRDTKMIDAIKKSLETRAKGVTAIRATLAALIAMLREGGDPVESLGAYHRAYGDSQALQSRLLRLWADYESEIAVVLALANGREQGTADDRFEAARIVLLMRAMTWTEVLDLARAAGENALAAIEEWLIRHASGFRP